MIVPKTMADRKAPVVPEFHMTRGLGFCFTLKDNYLMHLHCKAAAKFMEGYGTAPEQPQIDLSHYENTNKTKWYGGK